MYSAPRGGIGLSVMLLMASLFPIDNFRSNFERSLIQSNVPWSWQALLESVFQKWLQQSAANKISTVFINSGNFLWRNWSHGLHGNSSMFGENVWRNLLTSRSRGEFAIKLTETRSISWTIALIRGSFSSNQIDTSKVWPVGGASKEKESKLRKGNWLGSHHV